MATILRRLKANLYSGEVLSPALNKVKWQQTRLLNVLEHISYEFLQSANITVPNFGVAKSKEEAIKVAKNLDTNDLVLKAQVLAGGRGRGHFKNGLKGGVRMAYNVQEVGDVASKMIGQYLVTKQTDSKGRICNKVMVTERKYPRKEYYFSIMLERSFQGPVVIASSQGGVSIEDVAAESPEAIFYEPINILEGLKEDQAACIAQKVGMKGKEIKKAAKMLMNLYALFMKKDALLLEINPYAEDCCGQYFALDCKMRFDDNAAFRQKELHALKDWSQEDVKEKVAAQFDLNYIALDGNIGCMVNGAGLAMATMDIIKMHGGDPANFLDVGGSGTANVVKEGFKIIVTDPKVDVILVNIFGGIMRCDIIAQGIIEASKELNLKIPVVWRLRGTNVEDAKAIIDKSGSKVLLIEDLDEAARKAVVFGQIMKLAHTAKLKINFEVPK